MKLNSINSIFAKSVAVLAACAAMNASAGTAPAPKAPAPVAPPSSGSLFDSIGADINAGYDSRYYFRGLWFADNIITTAINLSIPLIGGGQEDGSSLTWGLGAAYIATIETPFNVAATNARTTNGFDYSEFDLYTSLNYNVGWAKFGLQYQYYGYPDSYSGSTNGVNNVATDPEFGIKGAGEVGMTVAVPLGAANIYAGAYHDFQVSGQYFQLGADYNFAVNDWLTIVPAFQTGYGINYYTGNASASTRSALTQWNGSPVGPKSGLTHMLFSISAPVKITKSATFTPYVALNNGLRTRTGLNTTQNEVFWGAKVTVTF